MLVGVAVDGERLIIQPQTKSSYTLDKLLAQCDPAVPISEEEQAWLDMPSVGQEL
jgi:antitoxin component of MazEF toxin-antitoxin module